jgi:hypothetical protein
MPVRGRLGRQGLESILPSRHRQHRVSPSGELSSEDKADPG